MFVYLTGQDNDLDATSGERNDEDTEWNIASGMEDAAG